MKTYNCIHCNKEQKSRGVNFANKYCDNKCQQEAQYKKRIEEWQSGGKFGKNYVKRYLAEKQDGCWQCNITTWMDKKIVLELEHIDGNSNNNKEENLSLLCPNCHSQTPTYKSKNLGNGRHARRERYAAGKSF
jgi:5-methylcytosine-specific restriction endonuclease McrA